MLYQDVKNEQKGVCPEGIPKKVQQLSTKVRRHERLLKRAKRKIRHSFINTGNSGHFKVEHAIEY